MGQRDCPPGKGSLSQNHCPPELGGTTSFIHHEERKQAQRWGGTCPERDGNRSWLSQRVGPCLLHSQQLPPPPRGQELGGGRAELMPMGCFALFPVTVPQRGSLTRVGLHIPQAGTRLGCTTATAVPSLLAPGRCFQLERPL